MTVGGATQVKGAVLSVNGVLYGGNQTLIFMRPEGSRMGMFVLDLDGHEMDVVQLSVNPDHLSENISKYDHHRSDDDKD